MDFNFHFDDREVDPTISKWEGGDVDFRVVVSAFPDKLVSESLKLGYNGVWWGGYSCMVPEEGKNVCFKHQYSSSQS